MSRTKADLVAELRDLRAERRQLQSVLSALHETSVVLFDQDGRVLTAWGSATHERERGIPPKTLVGGYVWSFQKSRRAEVGLADIRKVFETGDSLRREGRIDLPSGEFIYDALLSPVRSESGEVEVVVGVFTEITERVRMEESLRASEERMRAVLTSLVKTYVAIYDLDLQMVAVYGKRSSEYGMARDDAVGTPPERFLPKDQIRLGHQQLREVIETGEPRVRQQTVHLPGGRFVFDVANSPIRDAAGKVRFVLSVCHDISDRVREEEERRRFETRMQQAQKLESLGVLAGGIAHDFNNLLVGILGSADLVLHKVAPDSPLRGPLEDIEVASRHASELTSQLLAYAGRSSITIEPIDLSMLVENMQSLLRAGVVKTADLRFERGAREPWALADATQLRQVVMNLVSNAAEAIEDGCGEVVVRTDVFEATADYLAKCVLDGDLAAGEYAFIEVSDTGSGLATASVARIFDPFFTTKFHGRGLGLSAVMGIVRGHGGTIRVDNESARGTTFRVMFPLVRSAETAASGASRETEAWRGDGTLLVVDDSPFVRRISQRVLSDRGFEVLTAANGREAIEQMHDASDRVVAALLDLTMPVMNGEETFRALRSLRPELPILFMSGYSEEEVEDRLAGELGVARLQKPFSIEALVGAVKGLLDGS